MQSKFGTVSTFDEIFDSFFGTNGPTIKYVPQSSDTLAYETDDDIILELDLPGYSKKSISITMEKGSLIIEAEKKTDVDDGVRYLIRNTAASTYKRSYKLPENASTEIEAKFKDGVLSITIPKKEESKPTKVTVS